MADLAHLPCLDLPLDVFALCLKLSMKRGPPQQLTFCHRVLVVSLGIVHLLFPLFMLPHFLELHISCCGGPLAPLQRK